MDTITFRALTPADWPHIATLFGANGACGGCWCMHWRVPKGGATWQAAKGEPNRRRFKAMVEKGQVHAILAFAGDEPVGWCSFGPRASFPRLAGARSLKRAGGPKTWSIVCFTIARGWRRKGLGGRLLDQATRAAFRLGATEVEGYPVSDQAGAASTSFAWTGFAAMFDDAGYEVCPRPGETRPLYLKGRA